ncbi:MAG: FmdB family zinc ribbon protein [Burkholderiaceae bacterium]
MPIYAYACSACGFRQDILQKLSDAPLSECPSCHEASFSKQLTAPGFVLKGSGWYVTDFRDNGSNKGSKKNAGDAPVKATEPSAKADASGGASAAEASSTAAPTQGVTSSKTSDTPASSSPAAASASSSTGGAAKAAP